MAQMTATDIDNLPDSAFAFIESGGTKDSSGKTVPRSLRHLPIQDEAHVRNALARLSASPFEKQARPAVEAAAKKMGIGEPAQKASELKAEPLTVSQYDRWLKGEISRRILVVPFGGQLPSPYNKAGMDIDHQFFHDATDLYGPFPSLRASRDRVTDWHHDLDPTGATKGAIIGRTVLDDHAETVNLDGLPYAGVWGDFWANAGEKRRQLVAMMERQLRQQLYGSSQAVKGAVKIDPVTGSIDVWPVTRHTITTSPQNGLAIVPTMKAVLDSDPASLTVGALRAFLTGLDAFEPELGTNFSGGGANFPPSGDFTVKAGRVFSSANEQSLRSIVDEINALLAKLVKNDAAEESSEPKGG